jgi:hypothetical protein
METITLTDNFSSLKVIVRTFTEAISITDMLIKKLNGDLVDIWTKAVKITSSWTGVAKESTTWTKTPKT